MSLLSPRGTHSSEAVSANIISDGCRDYVVSITREQGTDLMRTWRGKVRRFASLVDAKEAAQRKRVSEIKLLMRVAADEACAGSSLQGSGFTSVTLATANH